MSHHHHDRRAATEHPHRSAGERRRHGPHPMGPRGRFGQAGRRSRRGDVRSAILLLLEESPRNGYQIIQELEERSGGAWRPSPGSVYPVLSQLEDEGLVATTEIDGARTVTLTEAGRVYVAERRESMGHPWESAMAGMSEPRRELMRSMRQLLVALRQVGEGASEEQVKKTNEILADARRRVYRVLSEDDAG